MKKMKTRHALAAKEIKKILKKEFPGIKFSVKSEGFANGSSVGVNWDNGPSTQQVEPHIKHFQYGHFNGMEDIYEYSNNREDIPQTKYLFCSRNITDDVVLEPAKKIHKERGGFEDQPEPIEETLCSSFKWEGGWDNWHQLVYRYANKTDFRQGVTLHDKWYEQL